MSATQQKSRVFVSFDYDHDEDLKILLVGQAKNPNTPFSLADWSVKEAITGDWKKEVRSRITSVSQLVVICGEHTASATGVSAEIKIAQEESVPYFLLHGRNGRSVTKSTAAFASDKVYNWTWDNLKILIGGGR